MIGEWELVEPWLITRIPGKTQAEQTANAKLLFPNEKQVWEVQESPTKVPDAAKPKPPPEGQK